MNRLKIFSFAIFSVLAVCLISCKSDSEVSQISTSKVKFTIGGCALNSGTRAANYGAEHDTIALDREKAIDNLYAVVYKDLQWQRTEQAVLDATSSKWSVELYESGSYDIYLVANSDNALLTKLTNAVDVATPDKLNEVIATKNPGADDQATNLLMTSARKNVVTKANDANGTDVGTIELTRAMARIDVDATNIDNFIINKVTFKNRYSSTYFARGTTNSTDMASLTKSDVVYDVSATASDICEATLYGYENLFDDTDDEKTTVLVVEGSFNGIDVIHEVVFENIPLQRNHLYYVYLIPEDKPNQYSEVNHVIKVKDWETGETLEWSGADKITNREAPTFVVAATGATFTPSSTDPTAVTLIDNQAINITVTVTSKSTSAKLLCTDKFDEVIISEADAQYTLAGETVQTFTIHLDENPLGSGNRMFTFAVENALKGSDRKVFTVTQPDI